MRRRLRHSIRLARDILRFATLGGSWWFVPVMVLLALVALLVTTTQAVVPVAVYTLF